MIRRKKLRPVLNGERYITDSELAEKLKLTRRTLADYRMNGRLRYYKVGGKLLYKEKDILVLLEKTGWKHLIIGNTRFQVSRHKHKKVMETIRREGFMAFLSQNWQIISFLSWNHISVSISISYM